ncbi:MAG: penicillin-binding protein activator LpoB [Chitinispirillaceae bacterium]|jgi:TolB-like protein|nr:penicillin-binding protein activator LpoB [Chitinispirillaceae bacterium]
MKYLLAGLILFLSSFTAFALEDDLNKLLSDLVKQDTTSGMHTLAVLPFACTLKDDPSDAGRTLAEYAVAFLANQNRYTLVDRMQFQKIAGELALSQSGMIDDQKAIEAGKLLSAQLIVTGNIGEMMGKRMISAQMIHVESGKVVSAASVTVGAEQLSQFYKDALGERTQRSSVIYRSLLAPGWGQFYTSHPVQGATFSLLALGSVGALVWSSFDYAEKNSTYNSYGSLSLDFTGKAKAKVAADRAYTQTLAITGVTVAVWVANVIDAAILGGQQKKRVRQMYFSAMPDKPGIAVTLKF